MTYTNSGSYDVSSVGLIKTDKSEEELRAKERQWESRLVTTENLDTMNRTRDKARVNPPKSTESRKKPHHADRPRSLTSKSNSESFNKSKVSKHLSHRADIPGISESDLIANGLYQLDDSQFSLFDDFAQMLSNFDHHDMVMQINKSVFSSTLSLPYAIH
jgi:hypothetical protein